MKIATQAPCRVDLAGGTLDIWPLYLYHSNAVTVNFAVNLYARCTLEPRRDRKIVLVSRDQRIEERFDSLEHLSAAAPCYQLTVAGYVARFFAPQTGFRFETLSEAPAGGGISGSSALVIAATKAFTRWMGIRYSLEKLREVSQNIEAQVIRVPAGAQDYYPAIYGGVNAIEMGPGGIARRAIPLDLEDFHERIVLAYTGAPRHSGINNWEVMKAHINGDRRVFRNFDQIAAIAHAMRQQLERGDWKEVGRLLREEWAHRRKNAPGITTPFIDRLVEVSRKAGAAGAKACGAGGGGCVFFLAERGAKARVTEAVAREGAQILNVRVAPQGVKVKTS